MGGNLQKGKTQQIINNGDIPCGVKINIDTTQIGNPVIKNISHIAIDVKPLFVRGQSIQ